MEALFERLSVALMDHIPLPYYGHEAELMFPETFKVNFVRIEFGLCTVKHILQMAGIGGDELDSEAADVLSCASSSDDSSMPPLTSME